MKFIYKICSKIKRIFESNYNKSLIHFKDNMCKKTCKIDENVRIYNKNVVVGKKVHLYNNVIIFGDGPVIIDDNVRVGYNTIIYSHNGGGIHIGTNTAIAANNYIIDTNHSVKQLDLLCEDPLRKGDTYKKIEIGRNVWIAASCVIAKGTKLKDGCIIGANSFVNSEIDENGIAVGNPAKVIKFRE